ncbi:MAG: vWA domain-containing protein [Candidatus Limnocylindrales bacterium]
MASSPDSRLSLPPLPGGRKGLVVDGERFVGSAVRFARALRLAGLTTDLGAAIDFARALALVDIGQREQVRAAGAALFVRRRDDLETYDAVFARFWRARGPRLGDDGPTPMVADPEVVEAEEDEAGGVAAEEGSDGRSREDARDGQLIPSDQDGDDPDAEEAIEGVIISEQAYSAGEVDRHRQFDRMTAAELRDAERLIDLLIPNLERRRTRRNELHRHGRIVAPRAMFRRSLATGGDVLDWVWRRPVRRPRALVVICDISGSMERHARVLLRFSQALAASTVRTEAFVFGTRLTRVTRILRDRNRDRALDRVADAVTDWSGGTRIGASFREFNQVWARRVLRSSSVVVIVSDGWDRGDPALVASETARLQRSCHRLIWLNPLASTPGYQPLAGGMSAAMPFVDDFVPAGTLASLERLGVLLSDAPTRREAERRARGFGGEGARSAGRAPLVESVRPEVHAVAAVRAPDDGSGGAAARPLEGRGPAG